MMSTFAKLVTYPPLLILALLIGLISFSASRAAAQTIPTRTPTPEAGDETPTSEPGGPGPGPTVSPTAQGATPAGPTPTATRFVLPPTPEGGYLPTAQPCSVEVYARATLSGLNVRSGPGLSYVVVGALLLDEVRPVIGRAPQATWWQIILADGTVGWVSNDLVDVSGYIGLIPTVAPPLLGTVTVTPGTPWAPTPQPNCTPPPIATIASNATATASVTAPAAALPAQDDNSMATLDADATQIAPPVAPGVTEAGVTPSATAAPQPTPSPRPLEAASSNGGSGLWIPLLGVGFIVAAGFMLMARRVRTQEDSST